MYLFTIGLLKREGCPQVASQYGFASHTLVMHPDSRFMAILRRESQR
jgi:hypothetical protein